MSLPLTLAAPAKVNLTLRVLGRRADGFHDLETLMAPLTLADQVTLAAGDRDGVEFHCDDPTLPADGGNLAVRAATVFHGRAGLPPRLRLTLEKHIPHGAGLGGGSSDAASVLLGLNEFHGFPLAPETLAELAAALGSDVPFFLARGPAVCRGRGERVTPVPSLAVGGATSVPLLLLKPPFGVPTPWAYSRWRDARELPGVRYAAQMFPWGELVNDLERPVFEKFVFLATLKGWLLEQPEVAGALLSGSGSTTLAVLRAPGRGGELARRATAAFGDSLWACETTTAVTG